MAIPKSSSSTAHRSAITTASASYNSPGTQIGQRGLWVRLYHYLKGIAIAAALVIPAASIQTFVILDLKLPQGSHLQWDILLMPIVVITTFGLLLGHIKILSLRIQQSSEKFRAVADVAKEFIYLRSLEGEYEYVSPACLELCGYTADKFYNQPSFMDQLIHPNDRSRWKNHVHNANHAGSPETLDIRLISRQGKVVWISHFCTPVFNRQGKQIAVRSSNVDITERKAFEKRIEHMAYFDPLSDLPNRRSLERTIERYISLNQDEYRPFALFFLDLDRFKYINDSHGHFLGDKLLQQIAQRLLDNAAGAEVTRFGGDEFIIVADNISSPERAIEYAEQIIDTLEDHFIIDDHELYLTGSIGIAFYPRDGTSVNELIKNADAAMYQSKAQTQHKIYLFSPDLTQKATDFLSIEGRIRKALEQQEFELYYQPKVSLTDGAIVGLEALARWIHPERGVIPPDQFIPVAEETGLILPLGQQLIIQAVTQVATWEQQGLSVPVAINISGQQFLDTKFCEFFEQQIEQSGCNPRLLQIEITEQVFLRDLETTITKLERIKEFGISVAIDDFGTGYSSLRYIKMLPIDTIKVDRSFILGAAEDAKDMAVLQAIASLCEGLEMEMVAEGIETIAHQQLVQGVGCKVAQGFLFYHPMPALQITDLLPGNIRQQNRSQ